MVIVELGSMGRDNVRLSTSLVREDEQLTQRNKSTSTFIERAYKEAE